MAPNKNNNMKEKTNYSDPGSKTVIQDNAGIDRRQHRNSSTPTDPGQGLRQDMMMQALAVIQEGLKSMQALQKQTAETHQKFLEF